MGGIITRNGPYLFSNLADFSHRLREEEQAPTKHDNSQLTPFRFELPQFLLRFIHVYVHTLLVEDKILDVQTMNQTSSARELLLSCRYVTAVGYRKRHHNVVRISNRRVDGEVGACTRHRPHIGELRSEELLRQIDGRELYLVYVLASCIHSLTRPSLRISLAQV